MKRRVVLISVVVLGTLASGFWAWGAFFGSGCALPESSPAKCVRKVGFEPVAGVEIRDAKTWGWQDTTTTFRLVGPAEAIDRALEAADFTAPLVDAPDAGARFRGPVDVEGLSDLRYGEDEWRGPHRTRHRQVLRATTSRGGSEEVLIVYAY